MVGKDADRLIWRWLEVGAKAATKGKAKSIKESKDLIFV